MLATTRPGNIWETVQLPALKKNRRITRVIAINPVTREESTIFER